MALTQTQVSQLYVSLFGRASEGDGNTFWQATADMTTAANNMLATTAAATYFGSSLDTNQAFVEYIYLNTLNKTATDDAAGITFWVDALAAGKSRGEVVASMISSAVAIQAEIAAGSTAYNAATVAAAQQFENRVTVSNYTADTLTAAPADYATSLAFNSANQTAGELTVTSVASTVTAAEAAVDLLVSPAQALTTATDTIVGTANNDTITGLSTTIQAADLILDTSTTDNDTFNMTLTATNNALRVTGVENVNADWNAFGTAGIDATNITGATITGTSTKVGFLGSMTVTAAGANTVVAGSGMIGTMTVNGVTAGTVTGGAATAIVAASANTAAATDTVVINAGTSTTAVTATDFKTMTINAGTATTVSLTDTATGAKTALDTASVTIGANATLNNDVDVLTLTASAADKTVTLVNTAGGVKSIDVAGTNNVTISVADASAAINTQMTAITKSSTGTLTYKTGATATGAADLTGIAADSFVFTSTIGATMTVDSGANVTLQADGGAATAFTTGTGTADTLTLNLSTSQTALAATSTETTTINVAATAVANAADVTLTALNVDTNTAVLTGANDVTITTLTAGTLDASAMTNALIVTQTAVAAANVLGGTAANTVNFKGVAVDSSYVGQDGVDTIDFVNTTGGATAVLGNGNNVVTANAAIQGATGALVVTAGNGNDTVTANGITTGTAVLNLGAGNNAVNLATSLTSGVLSVTTGAGTDTVTIGAATVTGTVTLALGDGTDTVSVANGTDLDAATLTMTGVDTILVAAGHGSAWSASDLSGVALNLKGVGTIGSGAFTDGLTVNGDVAGGQTINMSAMTLDATLANGAGGVYIVGNAGADTITGTAGNDNISTGNGNDTVTGGLGKDTYIGGTGVDTFVIASADTGLTVATADVIDDTTFTTTTDKLSLGTAGSVTNYTEIAGVAADTLTLALEDVNTAMDGTVKYVFVYALDADVGTGGADLADGALFIDADMNGTADDMIIITGAADGNSLAFGDIIA